MLPHENCKRSAEVQREAERFGSSSEKKCNPLNILPENPRDSGASVLMPMERRESDRQ